MKGEINMYFDICTHVEFYCENCGKDLVANFNLEDGTDRVTCTCGTVWVVVRPIRSFKENE